eukprot:9488627-Alexandrium_andersonii.AAC.1
MALRHCRAGRFISGGASSAVLGECRASAAMSSMVWCCLAGAFCSSASSSPALVLNRDRYTHIPARRGLATGCET